MIQNEIDKFSDEDPSRIFLGGYGDGADMALATFVRYTGEEPLGGVFVIDGMVPLY